MKKLSCILIFVLVMALTLTACSAKPVESNTDSVSTENTPGTTTTDTADDTVYNLSFTIHQPATTAFCKALDEWAADLKEKSSGRLNVEIYYGGTLASAFDAVDFVQQGGADMCWSTVSLNASKFTYCNILSLYGSELTNAELSTYVYMNLCKNCPAFSDEFESLGVTLLAAHGMTPSLLAGKGEKMETLDDFKGVPVMSISKTCISVLDSLGSAVIGVTPADLYENFSKNVVSASLIDASLYVSNKLYEQFEWMNTYNYNSALAFVVMNEDKYNSLPSDLQDLLMSEFDTLSLACAQYTDEDFSAFINDAVDQYGIEIYDASPQVIDKIQSELVTLVKEPWAEACNSAGYNPDEIQALIENYITEGRVAYGGQYDWFN